MKALRPREIAVLGRPEPHLVVYYGASYESGGAELDRATAAAPRLGWLLFDLKSTSASAGTRHKPMAKTLVAPWDVIDAWTPRVQQHFPMEAFALFCALWSHPEEFRGRDVLWLVDNQGTVGAMMKGYPRVKTWRPC